jgi:cobalt-zinc-cadmium efflux system outer membrane protein
MTHWRELLALLALSGGLAHADETALSLKQARDLALAHNWDLLAAQADLDQAEAQRLVAGALPNPDVTVSLQKLGTIAGTSTRSRDAILAVSQLIEIGGKRRARIRSAKSGIAAARERFRFARLRLDAGLIKTYANALAAQEGALISRQSAGSLSHSAEIADTRLSAGEISEVERDQVRIAAGRFEGDAQAAEAAAMQARIALQLLVGAQKPDSRPTLSDDFQTLGAIAERVSPDVEQGADWSSRISARGDVRAASADVEKAEQDLRLQKALRIPDPTLQAQYESELPDTPHTVGVGVSLPLPLFSMNRGAIRAAEIARDSARRALDQMRAQAWAEIETARTAFHAALRRRDAYRDELLPRALKVQQTIAFAYEKGGASLLELLEAERSLNDVRLAAASASADLVSAAADLRAALGEEVIE